MHTCGKGEAEGPRGGVQLGLHSNTGVWFVPLFALVTVLDTIVNKEFQRKEKKCSLSVFNSLGKLCVPVCLYE